MTVSEYFRVLDKDIEIVIYDNTGLKLFYGEPEDIPMRLMDANILICGIEGTLLMITLAG